MARKRKKVAKTGPVWHESAEEATLAKMPRYDAWTCGHGPHGGYGYERAKEKRAWRKQMRREGARDGLLSFSPVASPRLLGAQGKRQAAARVSPSPHEARVPHAV